MSAAVFQGQDVVHFLHRRVTTSFEAVLAQRVSLYVGVANLSPPVVVTLVDLRVTLMLPVTRVLGFSVDWAEPGVGQLRTARR